MLSLSWLISFDLCFRDWPLQIFHKDNTGNRKNWRLSSPSHNIEFELETTTTMEGIFSFHIIIFYYIGIIFFWKLLKWHLRFFSLPDLFGHTAHGNDLCSNPLRNNFASHLRILSSFNLIGICDHDTLQFVPKLLWINFKWNLKTFSFFNMFWHTTQEILRNKIVKFRS